MLYKQNNIGEKLNKTLVLITHDRDYCIKQRMNNLFRKTQKYLISKYFF